MPHAERDRELPEHVAGPPLADHALDAVDDHDDVHPALEDAEQRPLVALECGELAGVERQVGGDAAEALVVGRREGCEHVEPGQLLGRHHPSWISRAAPRTSISNSMPTIGGRAKCHAKWSDATPLAASSRSTSGPMSCTV